MSIIIIIIIILIARSRSWLTLNAAISRKSASQNYSKKSVGIYRYFGVQWGNRHTNRHEHTHALTLAAHAR